MKFSIIVPVYNVQTYLSQTIESVLRQTYKDFELILVNDGSTDSSLSICNKYQQKDSRVIVVDKQNQGVASARNSGLDVAQGEYVMFLDADDEMTCDCLSCLNSVILNGNPQAILGNFITWYDKTFGTRKYIEDNVSAFIPDYHNKSFVELMTEYIEKKYQMPWNPYQIVYNLRFINSIHARYNTAYTVAEDCDFFYNIFDKITEYKVTTKSFVLHRLEIHNSLMHTQNKKNIMSQLIVFKKFFNHANIFFNERDARNYFADRIANTIVLCGNIKNKSDRKYCLAYAETLLGDLYFTSNKGKYNLLKELYPKLGIEATVIFLARLRELIRISREIKSSVVSVLLKKILRS